MTVTVEFASVGEQRRCWFCTYILLSSFYSV